MKKNLLIPGLSLILAVLLLLGLTHFLGPVAENNRDALLHSTMQQLLPDAKTFTPEEYTGEDQAIRAVYKGDTGYVVEAAATGYVDELRLLVGVRNDGTVSGLTVKDSGETGGLGQRILHDRSFLGQYLGTSGDAAVGENIDALTGATVTTKAVTRAVNSAVAFVTGADAASSATEWSG